MKTTETNPQQSNQSSDEERAIARLKQSKEEAEKELVKAGEDAGVRHVLANPDFRRLDRLERWEERLGINRDVILDEITFRALAHVLDEDAAEEIEDSVREANGDDIDSPIWVQGFLDGALSKYEELKAKMD